MPTLLFAAMIASAAPPATEVDRLSRRLAENSALVSMVPMLIERDLTELAAEDPTLSPDQRRRLTAIGRAEGARNFEALKAAIARGYAARLSAAELRVLVASAESPAARKLRQVQPGVIVGAMTALGSIDLKKATAATFCAETARLCARK